MGEAFQVYNTLTTDDRKDYDAVKGRSLRAFKLEDIQFTSLSNVSRRKTSEVSFRIEEVLKQVVSTDGGGGKRATIIRTVHSRSS